MPLSNDAMRHCHRCSPPGGSSLADCSPNGTNTFFQYNAAGDLTRLTDGKGNTTTWQYDAFGRVTNKSDTLPNTVFAYRYDANGRLTNRWTPAKGNAGYCYDAVGNLTKVDYATSPDISLAYDALNRLTNMVDAVGQTRYGYDALGHLTLEDGPWADDAVSCTYTNSQRMSLSLQQPGGQASWGQNYAYDSARRLASVTSPAGTFGYGYKDGSPSLVTSNGLPCNLFISNEFDDLARLLTTQLKTSGGTVTNSLTYTYTLGTNRISQVTRTPGSTAAYTYDEADQLTGVTGKEPGGSTNRLNEQFGYVYDLAGNLSCRTNNALVQTFNVNGLNELTSVSRSGTMTVAGLVWGTATNVTVNTSNATRYADGTFAKEGFTLTDGTNTFTAVAKDNLGRVDTNVVKPYLPATVTFIYDANGNLVTNGTQILEYDDENQFSRVTQPNAWKSELTYDGKMRRRERWESVWDGSKWVANLLVRYIYDGMLVIQERHYNPQLSVTSPQLVVSYTRGRDLSGGLHGAGGIGGLLARTESGPLALAAPLATALYHADNVGNVTCLVATNGQVQARYLYEPFGTIIGMAGPLADRNLYRFSSKEWHENSGLVYYGYRYYSPSLQRWTVMDPAGETSGINLFGFCGQSPTRGVDPLGLSDYGDFGETWYPKPSSPHPPPRGCHYESRPPIQLTRPGSYVCPASGATCVPVGLLGIPALISTDYDPVVGAPLGWSFVMLLNLIFQDPISYEQLLWDMQHPRPPPGELWITAPRPPYVPSPKPPPPPNYPYSGGPVNLPPVQFIL